jgi:hypothetical protein
MHPRIYMYELLDLIINPLKYKCENYQIFIHPSSEMNAKCDS